MQQLELDPQLADFRRFLYRVFMVILGVPPTRVQYMIADVMQNVVKAAGRVPHEPSPTFLDRYPSLRDHRTGNITRRVIVQAYRGFGKSWIAACCAAWVLYWNQQEKVLCVSAAQTKSDEFTSFVMQLLHEVPELFFLIPDGAAGTRSSALKFDVAGAKPAQAPSVRSCGIFGQLTGGRGGVVIPDDIEVPKTSETLTLREKLSKISSEMGGAVLSKGGVMICLGTPQCEDTIYDVMEQERGYKKVIFPARMPDDKWLEHHGKYLAPFVHDILEEEGPASQTGGGLDGTLGQPLDPERFDEIELQEREAEYGRMGFLLQFQLDSALSDKDRFPLKLKDLIVMDDPGLKAPPEITWSGSPEYAATDLPSVGLRGDALRKPWTHSKAAEWIPWQGVVMTVDPSGRGKDETSYAVVKSCNGFLWLLASGGFRDGYDASTLTALANIAKKHKVQMVEVEPNFSDGLFTQTLSATFRDIYPCTVQDGPRAQVQKEQRIIDVLEPVLNQHLLVIARTVVEGDLEAHPGETQEMALKRSLLYQLTRITKERGALAHDDRLDALAQAVHYFMEHLGVDRDRAKKARDQRALEEEFRAHEESCTGRASARRRGWVHRPTI